MLHLRANRPPARLGGAKHIAPGVVSVAKLQKKWEERGGKPADNKNPQVLAVNGKCNWN
jgi:hypothetical protein